MLQQWFQCGQIQVVSRQCRPGLDPLLGVLQFMGGCQSQMPARRAMASVRGMQPSSGTPRRSSTSASRA